jgi:hypothetical protein
LDEEKSKYAGLSPENGFALANLLMPVKGIAKVCTAREGCNKYDLSAAPCF